VVPLFRAMGAILGATPVTIEVEGHTDAVPYRTDRDYGNWELSADRANAVRRLLVAGGFDPAAVTAVRGLAERVPLDPKHPTAHRNRRVTILVEWQDTAPDTPVVTHRPDAAKAHPSS
jgi:chemotaxis protein MotB